MRVGDWFNIGAITPFLCVLFSAAFGLFAGPAMSRPIECLWIIGGLSVAALTWFSAAKAQQNVREAKERGAANTRTLEKILQKTAEPGATMADVERIIHDSTVTLGAASAVASAGTVWIEHDDAK
jgi:hypothetical protein